MPYSIKLDLGLLTDNEASAIEARLAPLLGELSPRRNVSWLPLVASEFRSIDFEVVARAHRAGGVHPQWHVVEWFDSAAVITEFEDLASSCPSLLSGLAHVVQTCDEVRHWPTSLQLNEDGRGYTFMFGSELFARVRPIDRSVALAGASMPVSRVESTLVGARKAASPNAELFKRVARWPGLAHLQMNSPLLSDAVQATFPCPAEWLISARRVFARAGVGEPTTAQVQKLVCAIFDAPSWNHLCALPGVGARAVDWMAFCGPFSIHRSDEASYEFTGVHLRLEDAFVDFVAQAAQLTPDPVDFRVTHLTDYPVGLQVSTGGEYETTAVRMNTMTRANTDPDWLNALDAACEQAGGVEDALTMLLQVGKPLDKKIETSAALKGHELLGSDGRWDFHHEHRRGEKFFAATLRGDDGRCLGSVTVYPHKGALVRVEDGWVLTGEYHCQRPLAFIKGISDETARMIRSNFFGLSSLGGLSMDQDTQQAYAKLREMSTAAGAVGR